MSLSTLLETYNKFVAENQDHRTTRWMLMQTPVPLLAILAIYVTFCLKWGPQLMQHRKPFKLKNTLIAYNAASVVVSIWMTYEALACGWWNDYSYRCQLVDYSDNPKALRMARLTHIYYICKLVELLDTVFFVVRKKDNQVTFLHLYHHSTMPIWSFCTAKFVPGGQMTFGIMLNCFVHSVMYSYYLLAALDPNNKMVLRLKPFVTRLQLTQFVAVIIHLLLVFVTDCSYPKAMPMIMIANLLLFFCLFLAFYKRAYRKPAESTVSFYFESKNNVNKEHTLKAKEEKNKIE